jgi:hypothetical protein
MNICLFFGFRSFQTHPLHLINRFFEVTLSGLGTLVTNLNDALVCQSPGDMELPKQGLDRFLHLLHDFIVATEHRSIHDLSSVVSFAPSILHRSKKPAPRKKIKDANDESEWDWELIKLQSFTMMKRVLALPLQDFMTDAQRESAITHITKSINEIFQNKDRTSLKNTVLKDLLFQVYSECIRTHGHGTGFYNLG